MREVNDSADHVSRCHVRNPPTLSKTQTTHAELDHALKLRTLVNKQEPLTERKLNSADMSDKLKSKLSAIFLPNSTYSAPSMSKSSPDKPHNQAEEQAAHPNVKTPLYRIPVILNDRDGRQRRQQTLESENARDELLKHGIKVRDFQAEADAKAQGHIAHIAREHMCTQAQAQAQSDREGCSERATEAAEATTSKS